MFSSMFPLVTPRQGACFTGRTTQYVGEDMRLSRTTECLGEKFGRSGAWTTTGTPRTPPGTPDTSVTTHDLTKKTKTTNFMAVHDNHITTSHGSSNKVHKLDDEDEDQEFYHA